MSGRSKSDFGPFSGLNSETTAKGCGPKLRRYVFQSFAENVLKFGNLKTITEIWGELQSRGVENSTLAASSTAG